VSAGLEVASREDLLALIGLLGRQEVLYKTQMAELREQNAGLVAANAELAARVAELERRANRTSGNSSMPPSTDVFGRPRDESGRAEPERAGPKRPRGKRPGATGSGLALVEDPQVVEHVFPRVCGGCAVVFAGMAEADSLGYVRRQCTDIPPGSVIVTETRWHTVGCGCGQVTAAAVPDQVPDAPYYGPALAALAVYLLVYRHVPVQRTAQLIADLTGAQVSTGSVASQLPTAAGIVAGSIRLIKAMLALGHVLHADETTTNIAGKRRYLHVACTESLTFLGLAPRSRAGVAGLGILPHFRGTMVHDAYFQLYDGYPNAPHQLCVAHVVRELTAQDELYPTEHWARQIRRSLSGLIKQADLARTQGLPHIPPERIETYKFYYRQGVAVGLSRHPRTSRTGAQSDATNLLERLRDRADQYLLFTTDQHVPPTNNLGERDQRPVKTQGKISGCHQSATGATHWLDVRSYVSSARKNGLGAYSALHQAMTGKPWMPQIALPA
jgi:transposase